MIPRPHRTRAAAVWLGLALAASLAAPCAAQVTAEEALLEPAPPTAPETAPETAPGTAPGTASALPGAAAVARLDFPAALAELAAMIAADPAAPAPRLARAALHMKMQRPALALADLDAVLAADPAHLPALRARVGIWNARRAWNRARADLDAALAAAPGDAQLLALRAEVNASAGMAAAALADYTAALAAAPDDADLLRARDALIAARGETLASGVTFGPEAVMSEAFVVEEGAASAPDTLYIVHAATDLAQELAAVDTALLDRAVDAGALRIVHLFTYTGDDASIWGNLAMICAGAQGFAATRAALSDAAGRAALDAAGSRDFAALERLLKAAYSVAGLEPGLARDCALDRARATRYLADWQAHRDAGAWRGVNLLDAWPTWVLNGTPVGPRDLAEHLTAIVPAAPTAAAASTASADDADDADADADDAGTPATVAQANSGASAAAPDQPAADASAAPVVPPGSAAAATPAIPPGSTAAPGQNTETGPASAPPPPTEAAGDGSPAPSAAAPRPAAADDDPPVAPVRFPRRPEPVGEARVPVALRGIYAPSLAACLGYLETIEAPARIDAVLPAMNPLDGAALGTILVTSRRVYLFTPLDTECAIAGSGAGGSGDWQGSFVCASPLAPDAAPPMHLAPAPADGTAPRISATYGKAAAVVLRQCRTLGQLGNAFAPLWAPEAATCTVAVPVEHGRFAFSVDAGGNLVLRMAPAVLPADAGKTLLHAVIDGTELGAAPGRWDGTGWQMSLGPFGAAADRLGWGMFLDVRATGAGFEARLPLFGSSAAMDSLAACAPTGD